MTQYNWGYPAALKNALDYLYREWNNKPAAIVSYGGRGGGKAAAQLREVSLGFWELALNCSTCFAGLRPLKPYQPFSEPLDLRQL